MNIWLPMRAIKGYTLSLIFMWGASGMWVIGQRELYWILTMVAGALISDYSIMVMDDVIIYVLWWWRRLWPKG